MFPIKIYLIVQQNGEWVSNSYRNIDDLQSDWGIYKGRDDTIGLIHIGFSRPEFSSIENKIVAPGLLYMTASARWILDPISSFADAEVAKIDQYPVYVVIDKWGYTKTLAEMSKIFIGLRTESTETSNIYDGWLTSLKTENKEKFEEVLNLGIFNDISYKENENKLPEDTRQIIGAYRFNSLSKGKPLKDHVDILNLAPPYILDLHINSLHFSVRTNNALRSVGVTKVEDLLEYSSLDLMKIKNFGARCIKNVSDCILNKIKSIQTTSLHNHKYISDTQKPKEEGDLQAKPTLSITDHSSFKASLTSSLNNLDTKIRTILEKRMGVGCKALTLQATADQYNITRERIRQLAAKGMLQLKQDAFFGNVLEDKLNALINSRPDAGLSIASLPILDSWFEGIDRYVEPLKYLLEYLIDDKLHMIKANAQIFISRIDQVYWDELLDRGEATLESLVNQNIIKDEVKRRLEDLLPIKANELRSELWIALQPRMFFSRNQDGTEFLTGVGRSAELYVQTVLLESETPLHFSDIPPIILSRFGKAIEERRVHNIFLGEGCYRFGPGTYGLRKHVPLTDDQMENIREHCEEIILSNEHDKQWTTTELLDLLEEEDENDYSGILTKNLVNICLLDSKKLSNLKRNVWTKANGQKLGASNRVEIAQAVESLLINKGRPMPYSEIKLELSRDRGLGQTFQLHSTDSIIRVRTGEWGLFYRDIPIDSNEQNQLILFLEQLLANLGRGIHISEIMELLSEKFPPANKFKDPTLIFSLAQRTKTMKISNAGQYLYLAKWGDTRRISIKNAVEQLILDLPPGGLSLSDISAKLSATLGREINRAVVYSNIVSSGARHNPATGLWEKIDPKSAD